jgi:predicted nuclease of predicted toxin-antitoxin system
VKFLVDAQLPPVMVRWLQAAGHEAEHVEDAGLRDSDDGPIWTHALKIGAVVVTKDEDFAARASGEKEAPVIVWLRIGNATNPALRVWFEPRLAGIVHLIGEGNRVIEVA